MITAVLQDENIAKPNFVVELVYCLLSLPTLDPNRSSSSGSTPLHMSANRGNVHIVQALLTHAALDVNKCNKLGFTALNSASGLGQEEVVQALLQFDGRDNVAGTTASGKGEAHAAPWSTQRLNVNKTTRKGVSPLNNASSHGYLRIAQMLLSHWSTNPNQATDKGWTSLNLAAFQGQQEVVDIFLNCPKIDINQKNGKGWSPLFSAAKRGRTDVVRRLLGEYGIRVNERTNNGWTPLNTAAYEGHSTIVELLLQYRGFGETANNFVNVNQQNNMGWSPLTSAVNRGHTDIVSLLLAHEVRGSSSSNKKTREWSSCTGSTSTSTQEDNVCSTLVSAVNNETIDSATMCIQYGMGINQVPRWFDRNKIGVESRVALYQYAISLPPQHEPLLNFFTCRLHVSNDLFTNSNSSLRVFSLRWPMNVAACIESFLLPSKVARKTYQQLVSYFLNTLNFWNEDGITQLYEATGRFNVEIVQFLLSHFNLNANQLSICYIDEDLQTCSLETPFENCMRFITEGIMVNDDIPNELAAIAMLLRDHNERLLTPQAPRMAPVPPVNKNKRRKTSGKTPDENWRGRGGGTGGLPG